MLAINRSTWLRLTQHHYFQGLSVCILMNIVKEGPSRVRRKISIFGLVLVLPISFDRLLNKWKIAELITGPEKIFNLLLYVVHVLIIVHSTGSLLTSGWWFIWLLNLLLFYFFLLFDLRLLLFFFFRWEAFCFSSFTFSLFLSFKSPSVFFILKFFLFLYLNLCLSSFLCPVILLLLKVLLMTYWCFHLYLDLFAIIIVHYWLDFLIKFHTKLLVFLSGKHALFWFISLNKIAFEFIFICLRRNSLWRFNTIAFLCFLRFVPFISVLFYSVD